MRILLQDHGASLADTLAAALAGHAEVLRSGYEADVLVAVDPHTVPMVRARGFVAWARDPSASPGAGWDTVVRPRAGAGPAACIPDGFPPVARPRGPAGDRLVCPAASPVALAPLLAAWPELWARFALPLWIVGPADPSRPPLPGVVRGVPEARAAECVERAVALLLPGGAAVAGALARSAASMGVPIVAASGGADPDLEPLVVPVDGSPLAWSHGVGRAVDERAALGAALRGLAAERPWSLVASEWLALLGPLAAVSRPLRWGARAELSLLDGEGGADPAVDALAAELEGAGWTIRRHRGTPALAPLLDDPARALPTLIAPRTCTPAALAAIDALPLRPPVAALVGPGEHPPPGWARALDGLLPLGPTPRAVASVLAWLARPALGRRWAPPTILP